VQGCRSYAVEVSRRALGDQTRVSACDSSKRPAARPFMVSRGVECRRVPLDSLVVTNRQPIEAACPRKSFRKFPKKAEYDKENYSHIYKTHAQSGLLWLLSVGLASAQRSVTPLEYGQVFGYPSTSDYSQTGILVLLPHAADLQST
jgi:hypothetical protein